MNKKNKQRAKLALAELEKEMEILSKEEMKTCKGGMFDDYNLDLSGYITLIRRTDDPFDTLTSVSDVTIRVEKGILNTYQSLSIGSSSGHYMKMSDNQEAYRLFEFLAQKSDVEYSLIKTMQGSYITTSHQKEREELGGKVLINLISSGIVVTEHCHNHPVRFPECLGPSGGILPCDNNTNGDAQLVKKIQDRFPNSNVRFVVYEPSVGIYYEYDNTKIIKQW